MRNAPRTQAHILLAGEDGAPDRMAKAPPNTPAKGDRFRLRGRDRTGRVNKVNEERGWATVTWDDGGETLVHLHEMEKIQREE